jgi:hypothetical protein
VGGNAVGDAERPGQERAVAILHDEQTTGDERGKRTEPRPAGAGSLAHAGQLKGEADARPSPGDVVVEIAVEALEPGVEIGRQGDEEKLDVQRQGEAAREAAQPISSPAASAASASASPSPGVRADLPGQPQERSVPATEQVVDPSET